MKLSTMSPVPWYVLSHELKATAKDPLASPFIGRLTSFDLSGTEKARVLAEISERVAGIKTERQDGSVVKPKRPSFHVKAFQMFVYDKGHQYRYDSVNAARIAGYDTNSKLIKKLREGGYHQSKAGLVYWSLVAPEFIQQWQATGVMVMPVLPRKVIGAGKKYIPCFSYVRDGSIEYHLTMKLALTRAFPGYHNNVFRDISTGQGFRHFKNGSWVWRASVPTPDQVVMLIANNSQE